MSELLISPVEQALLRRTEQLNDLAANMANLSSPGAKSEKTFETYVDGEIIMQTAVDHSQGALKPTSDQGQLALNGLGQFVVQNQQGIEQFVRQVRIEVINSQLKTSDGHFLLGQAGVISIDATEPWTVKADGSIFQGDAFIDKIQLTDTQTQVLQGFIEQSNIDPAAEMIELIKVSRSTESYQTVIKTQSKMTQSAFDQLGGL
ncbi:flagellar basal body rod C-terminal domain-containing protein [Marinicellulosiphila megalodicopiae]|uniref:flagellar basal body rod C-terminal domain-containing protein n=1 Tax=Marinicellulosiphila megalodicopiae TaxID=2724896 RepID=UPI003BB0D408